jgi:hypothetical protein
MPDDNKATKPPWDSRKDGAAAARLHRPLAGGYPRRKIMAAIREGMSFYGFEPAEQPMIEYTTRLVNSCPTRTGRTKACFPSRTMTSSGCRRYMTAPLARWRGGEFREAAEALPQLPRRLGVPQRKAGPGRFRRSQFDADTVGPPGVAADGNAHDGRRDGVVNKRGTTLSASTTARCSTAS